jgi:acyl carrier protein
LVGKIGSQEDYYAEPDWRAIANINIKMATNWSPVMTISGLTTMSRATATKSALATNNVRTVIADCLGLNVECVADEAYFADDLGADWLDRLELMMMIEDRFTDVEITDDDADHIETVGDLVRFIEGAGQEKRVR